MDCKFSVILFFLLNFCESLKLKVGLNILPMSRVYHNRILPHFSTQNQAMCHGNIGSSQCSRRFLNIVGQNPSVSKSNQLHVVISRVIFIIICCYIPHIPLKWWVVFLKSWTSTGSYVTSDWFYSFLGSSPIEIQSKPHQNSGIHTLPMWSWSLIVASTMDSR